MTFLSSPCSNRRKLTYASAILRLKEEDARWQALLNKTKERCKVVLDFSLPYNSAHPPGFLFQQDNELLTSSLGEGVDSTSFDAKKVKDEVTLNVDQLQHIISALKRTTEVIFHFFVSPFVQINHQHFFSFKQAVSESCESTVRRLNEISFEAYPNQKHPQLLVETVQEREE